MPTNYVKKIVVLVLLIIIILTLGTISIDKRENVVVTNIFTKKESVLTPGIHFTWPLVERVNYIFMNKREGLFTVNLPFNETSKAEISVAIQWQVINPQTYLSVYENFHKMLANKVTELLEIRIKTTDLSTFNQLNDLISDPLIANDLGIEIISISLNQLKIDSTNIKIPAPINIESSVSSRPQISIESAYYQAQMLKINTDLEQVQMYQSLSNVESSFYRFFRKLQVYKMNARSNDDLPPINDLYK